ncbi:MAG: dipeptide epimerase [Candidatus Omnitrophica bacterium]|nr:dipeptide epimerase [Candidatus Omnitrophota bacterium]
MNDPVIAAVTHAPWNLPLRQPFVTARGRKTVSQNLLITVTLAGGSRRWTGRGEASASLAWPDDAQPAMRQCLHALSPRLIGAPARRAWHDLREAWSAPNASPAALSAVECALATAEAAAAGLPLWRALASRMVGVATRPRPVMTSLTISAWPVSMAEAAARAAARRGFRRLKVKVTGANPDDDLARLMAVHRAAPRATLLVDANQGFPPRGAIAFARAMRLLRLPVALFEQPVPAADVEGMAQVARARVVPVAADESVRRPAEARRLLAEGGASVINLKLAKSGLLGAREIIRLARRARVDLMLGCMAESAVGLAPSVHLACGSGAFRYIDLDSHLLVDGPKTTAFRTRGPRLSVA